MGPIVETPEDVARILVWAQESEERTRTGSAELKDIRLRAAELDRENAKLRNCESSFGALES